MVIYTSSSSSSWGYRSRVWRGGVGEVGLERGEVVLFFFVVNIFWVRELEISISRPQIFVMQQAGQRVLIIGGLRCMTLMMTDAAFMEIHLCMREAIARRRCAASSTHSLLLHSV